MTRPSYSLAILDQFRPHVVVTDLSMPLEDGYWLLDEVRRLPPEGGGRVPIIAITAYGSAQRRLALKSRFHSFIPKPFEVGELCDAVAKAAADGAGGPDAPMKR